MSARYPVRLVTTRAPVWHAVGLALALLAGPAPLAAQAPARTNIEACQQDHFDPARYRADLEAEGWQVASDSERAQALRALADAFVPVFESDAADPAAIRDDALAFWQDETEGRLIMVQPGAVVFLSGSVAGDGRRAVECWMALQDGTLVEGLIAGATNADEIEDHMQIFVPFGPFQLEGGRDFSLVVTRHPAPAGVTLAASHGMMTRTEFPPSD